MTAYAKPVAQRPQNWLAQLRGLAAALASGGTEYIVEYPNRKAGETAPESERGNTVAILGNLAHDAEGNSTGLSGWGIAVRIATGWINLGADTGWIAVVLKNSWTTYIPVEYRKIGNTVRLRGSLLTAGASATIAFKLPEGPTQEAIYTAPPGIQTTPATVVVKTNGEVEIVYTSGTTSVSFDGITFMVD